MKVRAQRGHCGACGRSHSRFKQRRAGLAGGVRSGWSLGLRWGSRPGGITEGLACPASDVIGSQAPAPGGPGLTHLCVFRWLWGSAPHPPGLLSSLTPWARPARGHPSSTCRSPVCQPREEALTSSLLLARGPSYAW